MQIKTLLLVAPFPLRGTRWRSISSDPDRRYLPRSQPINSSLSLPIPSGEVNSPKKIQGHRLNVQLKRVVEHPHLQPFQRISPRAFPRLLNGQPNCLAGSKNQNKESGYFSPTLPTGGQPWNLKIISLIHWIEESTHTSGIISAR